MVEDNNSEVLSALHFLLSWKDTRWQAQGPYQSEIKLLPIPEPRQNNSKIRTTTCNHVDGVQHNSGKNCFHECYVGGAPGGGQGTICTNDQLLTFYPKINL